MKFWRRAERSDMRFDKAELLRRQAQQWSTVGEEAPYWSVFCGCSKTASVEKEELEEFYRSGEDEIKLLRDFFRCAGHELPRGLCVDWGCGLGRVTHHLATLFRHVVGVDISEPHLRIARAYTDNLEEQMRRRIKFQHLVEDERELSVLTGKVDLVHSILVLQHMPPPLMIDTLALFARLLKKGGYAFFQVPTYGERYDYKNFDLAHDAAFDMHVLPQHEIHTIFRENGCRAVATFEKDRTGPEFLSHYFIFQKA